MYLMRMTASSHSGVRPNLIGRGSRRRHTRGTPQGKPMLM
jgi:hypothetical protein